MRRRKSVVVEKGPLFTEVTESVQEILQKLGIKDTMSQAYMIQVVRSYIENQTNQIRTCNAILYKLGVSEQIKGSPRRARIFALTAIDEALKQGTSFNPETVKSVAEARLLKVTRMLGQEVVENVKETVEKPVKVKKQSKKDIATEIFLKYENKPKDFIIDKIMKKLKVERQAAQGYIYQVKRSLTV